MSSTGIKYIISIVAHYAFATHNTDLAIYLLKVMIDVNLVTNDTHDGEQSFRFHPILYFTEAFL